MVDIIALMVVGRPEWSGQSGQSNFSAWLDMMECMQVYSNVVLDHVGFQSRRRLVQENAKVGLCSMKCCLGTGSLDPVATVTMVSIWNWSEPCGRRSRAAWSPEKSG